MTKSEKAEKKAEKKADKEEKAEKGERKRDQFGDYLYIPPPCLPQVYADHPCRVKNYNKSELALKHAVGLGHVPNAVPVAKPKFRERPRPVEVGWHPVGGVAGKWFAEDTGLGKIITERINKYPDPTQHWAVLVGDYAHQLWMVNSNSSLTHTRQQSLMKSLLRMRNSVSFTPTRKSTGNSGVCFPLERLGSMMMPSVVQVNYPKDDIET